jgi:hypothetical protein
MSADSVSDETLQTSSGTLDTKRWHVTVHRPDRPDRVVSREIWVARGRMVRLDLPEDGISVIRQDVVGGGAR